MKSFIDRIKTDKVLFFLSVLIIGIFLVLIIRITYSYLAANINEAGNNVTMGSDKTDELKFIKGDNLILNATPTTLPEGGANYVDSTTYSASLKANSTNNTANYTYYVYFNIPTNTINYIEDNTPEVILTIRQGDNTITNISGLTYGTYNGVAGFDITNKTGLFTVASNYAISSTSSSTATIQDWTFTLTYLNQGYDQSANYGNSMNVKVIMSKEEKELTLADLCNELTLAECITTKVYDESKVDETGLYYHDTNLANSAADNSYRYAGTNPNNYVCFGSDASTCSSENLYRIIGIFGSEVKLIKSTSYGNYVWDNGNSNTWDASTKPDIRSTLNTTYLNTLSATWQNKIATHTWKVGGMTYSSTYTVKQYYDIEVGSSSNSTTDSMKIGLMYVSDYGFAASPSYWTTELYNYEPSKSSNWMNVNINEWTISRNSGGSAGAFIVYSRGRVDIYDVGSRIAVRPVFYLTSSTSYVSGSGSSADPIRIN